MGKTQELGGLIHFLGKGNSKELKITSRILAKEKQTKQTLITKTKVPLTNITMK